MDVLFLVRDISGTTIPVDIGARADRLPDLRVRLVSRRPLSGGLPDTVAEEQVLRDLCGFDDYGALLGRLADQFDAVHTHTVAEAAYTGYHALRLPLVHLNTQHGHSHYTAGEKVKNLPGLLLSDALVYNSAWTASSYSLLERPFKYRASEHVVHNGVDLDAVAGYEATVTAPPTIVTAGRLIERKNIETLVRALVHADDASLQVVGDGPQRGALERLSQAVGVDDRVEFLGYLPNRTDVYAAFAAADVFALPSHGEGFCVAVAEAMAVGLPVVVSDIPVFHEVVGPGGVYVDRTDPAAIAAAIADCFVDVEHARRLGRRNRERIRERFTLERCARGYRDVYRAVLG